MKGLANASKSERFAYDAYRRLLDMFGDVVLGIPHEAFEERFEKLKKETGKQEDVQFTGEDLEKLCREYKEVYMEYNHVFPEDPYEQLKQCIRAVFGSWNSQVSKDDCPEYLYIYIYIYLTQKFSTVSACHQV